jgi:hypothetical protein
VSDPDPESDLIESLLSYDLEQVIIAIRNQYDSFFECRCGCCNVDLRIALLRLDRHNRAYELSVDLRICEFKAVETGREWCKFGMGL